MFYEVRRCESDDLNRNSPLTRNWRLREDSRLRSCRSRSIDAGTLKVLALWGGSARCLNIRKAAQRRL
jgi:hypothetical protein